jgi:hypothetical protein
MRQPLDARDSAEWATVGTLAAVLLGVDRLVVEIVQDVIDHRGAPARPNNVAIVVQISPTWAATGDGEPRAEMLRETVRGENNGNLDAP